MCCTYAFDLPNIKFMDLFSDIIEDMRNYIHGINDWMEMVSSKIGVERPLIYKSSFSHGGQGLDNIVINGEGNI